MQWLVDLITKDSTAHTVLILGLAVFPGIWLGTISLKGVKIGIAGVLFSGLIIGTFGLPLDTHVLHFIREFGLILFVFSIGLQVGPGFFANFKDSGFTFNLYALAVVMLGVGVAVIEKFWFGIPVDAMVGILSGAVTNTPGLGAAQQALKDIPDLVSTASSHSGTGYAVAYPFGIMGIIITMLLVRYFFKVKITEEAERFKLDLKGSQEQLKTYTVEVRNPMIVGKTIGELATHLQDGVVVSRHFREGLAQVAHDSGTIEEGDLLHIVCTKQGLEKALTLIGSVSSTDLRKTPSDIVVWKVLVSRLLGGLSLRQLRFKERHGVIITRVLRAGTEILPTPELNLQIGDQITVVGAQEKLKVFSKELGDSKASLLHPNILPIFLGIVLGILLGSVPIMIPGLPSPVKLGMAGGPLVIALLMGFKRSIGPLHFHLPESVGMFMREFGILLFLAAVGLSSGENFLKSLMEGTGFQWMFAGVAITLIPLLVVGFVARSRGMNFLSLSGLLAGSMTDPPALGYANSLSSSQAQSTAYASVYPFTMFLRIMSAQIFVMICI